MFTKLCLPFCRELGRRSEEHSLMLTSLYTDTFSFYELTLKYFYKWYLIFFFFGIFFLNIYYKLNLKCIETEGVGGGCGEKLEMSPYVSPSNLTGPNIFFTNINLPLLWNIYMIYIVIRTFKEWIAWSGVPQRVEKQRIL